MSGHAKLSPGFLPTTEPQSTATTEVDHAHVADVADRQLAALHHFPDLETVAAITDSKTHYFRALIPPNVEQFFVTFEADAEADGDVDITYNGTTYTVELDGGEQGGAPYARYGTPLWDCSGAATANQATEVEITILWSASAGTDPYLYRFAVVGFAV